MEYGLIGIFIVTLLVALPLRAPLLIQIFLSASAYAHSARHFSWLMALVLSKKNNNADECKSRPQRGF
jgi:hypothetical protein